MAIDFITAQGKHVKELCQLRHDIWKEIYPNMDLGIDFKILNDTFAFIHSKTINTVKHMICHSQDQYHTIIVLCDDKIIGFSIINYLENKIDAMNIAANFRNNGIGKRLLYLTLDKMDNMQDIFLHVVAYNHKAIDFYRHHGFKYIPALQKNAYVDFPLANDKILPLRGLYYRKYNANR